MRYRVHATSYYPDCNETAAIATQQLRLLPLMIKATVLNQDIGFVTKEMEVAVKIDTFDFQKYGLIHGNVKHIADDAIEDEKLGPVYEIAITPSDTTLKGEGKTLPSIRG